MKYECECGSGFERWNPELNAYVCARCGTLWEPDIQPATVAEVEVYEAEYEEARFDDDDEQHGDWCPECGGSGQDRYEPWFDCHYCMGEGYVWW